MDIMSEVITEINTNEPIGVRRFQILHDGVVKDFDKNGNIVDKRHYAVATSRNGSSWSSLGELTRDDLVTLGVVIQRFIEETK